MFEHIKIWWESPSAGQQLHQNGHKTELGFKIISWIAEFMSISDGAKSWLTWWTFEWISMGSLHYEFVTRHFSCHIRTHKESQWKRLRSYAGYKINFTVNLNPKFLWFLWDFWWKLQSLRISRKFSTEYIKRNTGIWQLLV